MIKKEQMIKKDQEKISTEFRLRDGQPGQMTMDGKTIHYMEWKDIPYCTNPQDPIQKLNLYVPMAYMKDGMVGPYSRDTAPIFCPNTVGGYLPGPSDEPGTDRFGRTNSIFQALNHGYVVLSAGVRGRTTGKNSQEFFEGSVIRNAQTGSRRCGQAPAFVVDMKAAIRWLRYYAKEIPGDPDKIIVSGTSAGGALAALLGASGNQKEYEPYLQEIGAYDEPDDVFAASCYCPIIDLDHADMAYEWQFGNEPEWKRTRRKKTEQGLVKETVTGHLSKQEMENSALLKALYPAYINSLQLHDENGRPLSLDEDGNGTFKDWIVRQLIQSAKQEKESHHYASTAKDEVVTASSPETKEWLQNGLDWDAYLHDITRMKSVPAFDDLSGASPENEEFGNEQNDRRHFTDFSTEHAADQAPKAEEEVIRLMNPLSFAGQQGTAPNWRIRHGSYDRDTSLAVPALLNLVLEKNGIHPDFAYPWGLPHSGDYDLPQLFEWIDQKAAAKDSQSDPCYSHRSGSLSESCSDSHSDNRTESHADCDSDPDHACKENEKAKAEDPS